MRRSLSILALLVIVFSTAGADAEDKKHPLNGTWNIFYRDAALGIVSGRVSVAEDERTGEVTLIHPGTGDEHELRASKISVKGQEVEITIEGKWPSDPNYRPAPFGSRIEIEDGASEIELKLGEGEATLSVRPSAPADLDKVILEMAILSNGNLQGRWRYRGDATTGRDREGKGPSGEFEFNEDDTGGAEILDSVVWNRLKPEILFSIPVEEQLNSPFDQATWPYPFAIGGASAPGAFARRRTLLVIGNDLPINRRDPVEFESLDPHFDYFVLARKEDFGRDTIKPFVDAAWDKVEFSIPPDQFAELRKLDAILIYAVMKPGVLPGRTGFKMNGAEGVWILEFGDFTGSIRVVRSVADDEFEPTDYVFRPERIHIEIHADRKLPFPEIPLFIGTDAPIKINDRREIMARLAGSGDYNPAGSDAAQKPKFVYRTGPIDLVRPGESTGAGISIPVEPGDVISAVIAKRGMLFTSPSHGRAEVLAMPPHVASVMLDDPAARSLTYLPALKIAAECAGKPFEEVNTLGGREATTIDNYVILSGNNPLLLELRPIQGQDPMQRKITVTLGDHAAMLMLRDGFIELLEAQKRELAKIQGDDLIRGYRRQLQPLAFNDEVPINRITITGPDGAPAKLQLTFLPGLLKSQYRLIGQARKQWVNKATLEAIRKYIVDIDYALGRARETTDCGVEELLALTAYNFGAVENVVLARTMKLERNGRRGIWRADRPTRSKIKSLFVLARAVRAQQDLATRDTQLFLASLAGGSLPAAAAGGATFASLAIAIDVLDFGYVLISELVWQYDMRQELHFARTAAAVLGYDRLREAELRDQPWWYSAANILFAGTLAGFSAYDSILKVGKFGAIRRGETLIKRINTDGIVDLSNAERKDLLAAMEYAQTIKARTAPRGERAYEAVRRGGASALRTVERRAIEFSDYLVKTWNKIRLGKPDWADVLSDADFSRIRDMARRKDVIKLVKSSPGAIRKIINDAEALDVFRGAPFEGLAQLQRAIKREADRVKDVIGRRFFRDTGPNGRRPKELNHVDDDPSGKNPFDTTKPDHIRSTAYIGIKNKRAELASFTRYLEVDPDDAGKFSVTMDIANIEFKLQDILTPLGRKLPTQITTPTPLIAKSGKTPLTLYMNLRTFNLLGVQFADPRLSFLKMSYVINSNTCIQLHWLRKVYPNVPLDELAKYTNSYRYAETSLQQAGFKITGVKLSPPQARYTASGMVDQKSAWYDQRVPGGDFLRRYQVKPDEEIDVAFNFKILVEPI
jgi:hypothetical protein